MRGTGKRSEGDWRAEPVRYLALKGTARGEVQVREPSHGDHHEEEEPRRGELDAIFGIEYNNEASVLEHLTPI